MYTKSLQSRSLQSRALRFMLHMNNENTYLNAEQIKRVPKRGSVINLIQHA